MTVEEYVCADGSNPYRAWFDRLTVQPAVKVAAAVARMAGGNTSAISWFRGIGEYVIDSGPGYRIYLAKDGADLIILFGGGTKNGQQAEIDEAIRLHNEYKARKKAKAAAKALADAKAAKAAKAAAQKAALKKGRK